ncbi:MAG: flippase-like domain-containing protein [Acidobacteria bacterium]|nr:flippase-like domain-containing protein [Acidobacteriota bacterium]
MRSVIVAAVKVAITLTIFYIIFRNIDSGAFVSTMRHARIEALLAGFLTLWIGHYTCIYRWRMLMRPLMPVMSVPRLLGIYCMGMFFNLALPTIVGGDVVKVYYTGKPTKSYAQSFAATFMDRDTGLFSMLAIACTATLLYPVSVPGIPVSLIIRCAFIAFLIGNIFIFVPGMHSRLTKSLRRMRLDGIAGKIDTVSAAFQIVGKRPSVLAGSVAISLINQFLYIAVVWFISRGLRLEVPFFYFLTFVPVITLVSMIPVSLNGLGLREYAFMSLFGGIGIAPASCIALGLFTSVIILLSSLPGGIVYIVYRNRGDRKPLASLDAEF